MTDLLSPEAELEWLPEDYAALEGAVQRLESVGLAMKIANHLGRRIEDQIKDLPQGLQDRILKATTDAMEGCAWLAMKTVDPSAAHEPFNGVHKAVCTASGAISGFFGVAALIPELPFTTAVMLRSFFEIGRHQGEDLLLPDTKLTCIEVFALGGHTGWDPDPKARPHYYEERDDMANLKAAAAKIAAQQGSRQLAMYLDKVVSRFAARVTEKAVGQSHPVVGAIGGGAINFIFVDHYQDVAEGHFTVRRLERKYGAATVRVEYEKAYRRLCVQFVGGH